jgi:molybdopterin molybdotransferase
MDASSLSLSELTKMEDYDPNSMRVEQARQLIRQFLVPLKATEAPPLQQAYLRTLAADVISPMNVPPHDYSAMDGYAARHADLQQAPCRLRLAGTAYAGRPYDGQVGAGECVRIMTGSLIPAGCDCVVMQEHVRVHGEEIEIGAGHKRGQNIRLVGEDIRQGSVVLQRGRVLRAAEMGLLASLGFAEVSVFRKLRVAIFSTGDELRQPGTPLGSGQIYDSNRYSLIGLLTELGVEIIDLGNIRDDKDTIRATLLQASSQADAIITSGGVSVGEADFIKQLLAELGEVVFWKLAMKPGKPLAYGKVGQAHFFGLPGNPVAVMVTFLQFVRDALCVLMGQEPEPALTLRATTTSPIRKAAGRTEFQRGILSQNADGHWLVKATGDQGSGILSSMTRANCFIVLPEEQGHAEPGLSVQVQPF